MSLTVGVLKGVYQRFYWDHLLDIPWSLRKTVIIDSLQYILISMCVIYVGLAVVTYSIVLWRSRKRREMIRSATVNKKQYLVPGLIILTFLLLYHIPYPIYIMTPNTSETYEEEYAYFIRFEVCEKLQMLGLVVDPIIYVLLSKHYRDSIMNIFTRREGSSDVTAVLREETNDL